MSGSARAARMPRRAATVCGASPRQQALFVLVLVLVFLSFVVASRRLQGGWPDLAGGATRRPERVLGILSGRDGSAAAPGRSNGAAFNTATVEASMTMPLPSSDTTPSSTPTWLPEAIAGATRVVAPTAAPTASYKSVISISLFIAPFHRDAADKALAAEVTTAPVQVVNKYSAPLINVILNWRWLLPDWGVRIHVPRGHPLVRQFEALGAEVKEMDFDQSRWSAAMTWRFLAEDDTGLEYWASREAESPPTYQDAAAIRGWQRSGLPLHAVHLRPAHNTWNGGTWGARRGFITALINSTMANAINAYSETWVERPFGSRYGDDQAFMRTLWKPVNMKKNGIAYLEESLRPNRTVCHFTECASWPPYPGRPDGFLASLNSINIDQLILCHYREAPFCRKVSFPKDRFAWRDLYELCVGSDFYSGRRLSYDELVTQRQRLDLDACPYHNIQPLDF